MRPFLRPLLCLATLGLTSQPLLAQTGVAIGALTPDASAVLDLASPTLGLLAPRVSLSGPTDATTIANPAQSLLAYNRATTVNGTAGLVINLGTPAAPNWQRFATALGTWSVTGNPGTNPTTNFLGTTDNQPLAFRVNNAEVARFLPGATLWMGSTSLRDIAIGRNAGASLQPDYDNEEGLNNLFVGVDAGNQTTTGNDNTFLGHEAGSSNNQGLNNTYVGSFTGVGLDGYNNTFVGGYAGRNAVAGGANTFLGALAGFSNAGGSENEFLGTSAGYANGTGRQNQFLGSHAGERNTSGSGNSFIGYYSGANNMAGSNNVFMGLRSGVNNSTGSGNIFLGYQTGANNTSGTNNVFIGTNAGLYDYTTTQYNNSTAIGYYAQIGASNVIALGGGGTYAAKVGIGTGTPSQQLHVIGNILASGTITQNSDRRLKTNVRTLTGALASVHRMRGVRYTFLPGKGPAGEQVGVIAQEVEAVYPELVITDPQTGLKSVNYAQLTPVLLEAIKELQAQLLSTKQQQQAQQAETTASLQELRDQLRQLQAAQPTLVRH